MRQKANAMRYQAFIGSNSEPQSTKRHATHFYSVVGSHMAEVIENKPSDRQTSQEASPAKSARRCRGDRSYCGKRPSFLADTMGPKLFLLFTVHSALILVISSVCAADSPKSAVPDRPAQDKAIILVQDLYKSAMRWTPFFGPRVRVS